MSVRIECSVLLLLAIAVPSTWSPSSNKVASLWHCHMVVANTATHVACAAATDRSLPRQFSLSRRRSRAQVLVAIAIAVTASSVFVFHIRLDAEEEEEAASQGELIQRKGRRKGAC